MSTTHIHDAAEVLIADLETIIDSLDQRELFSVYERMRSVSALSLMLNAAQRMDVYEPSPAERLLIEENEDAFANYGLPLATADDMDLDPFEGV